MEVTPQPQKINTPTAEAIKQSVSTAPQVEGMGVVSQTGRQAGITDQATIEAVKSPPLPTNSPTLDQVTAMDVYNSANLQASVEGQIPKPVDLSDPYQLRNQIMQDLGVNEAQEQYQTAFGDMLKAQQSSEARQNAIGDQTFRMNAIRGLQNKQARQDELSLSGMNRDLQILQNNLLAKKDEANTLFGIRNDELQQKRQLMLSNPGAGITAGDSFEVATEKLGKYQVEQREQELLTNLKLNYPTLAGKIKPGMNFNDAINKIGKGLEKNELKAQFTSMMGYPPDGLSKKEMKKKMRKQVKKQKEYEEEKIQYELAGMRKSLSGGGRSKGGSGVSNKLDKQFDRDIDYYKKMIWAGEMDREYAKKLIENEYPGYDSNIIYKAVPDGYSVKKKEKKNSYF